MRSAVAAQSPVVSAARSPGGDQAPFFLGCLPWSAVPWDQCPQMPQMWRILLGQSSGEGGKRQQKHRGRSQGPPMLALCRSLPLGWSLAFLAQPLDELKSGHTFFGAFDFFMETLSFFIGCTEPPVCSSMASSPDSAAAPLA